MAQLFPDIQRSPYKDRIIAILDSIHGKDIVQTLKKKGISEDKILTWSKNGLEYFYPQEIMREIFGSIGILSIVGDEVTMSGTTLRKLELAKKVSSKLKPSTKYPEEIETKLFPMIEAANI